MVEQGAAKRTAAVVVDSRSRPQRDGAARDGAARDLKQFARTLGGPSKVKLQPRRDLHNRVISTGDHS